MRVNLFAVLIFFNLLRPVVGYPVMFHACKIDPPVPGISRYIQYWATQVSDEEATRTCLNLSLGRWFLVIM